jgi:hypothetical protein
MKIYTVEALRWGDREKHSYVVGVFSDIEKAKAAAAEEEGARAGKYGCVILDYVLDRYVGYGDEDEQRD